MPEPKARKLAIAVLAVLVVIIVIPAVALFVRGDGVQPVQIMRVQGIGATTYTNIRDLVSVDTSP